MPGTPIAPTVTATALRLRWTASTDTGGSGIDGYDVYRDGALIGTTSALTYAVRGPATDARHEFTVVARDKAGNRSAPSSPLVVDVLRPTGGCNARSGACVVT